MELCAVRALVTGGTSGLGRAVAAAIVARGGRVAVLGRSVPRGEEVARTLGARCIFTPADVVRSDEVQGALDRAAEAFDGLNVLVNCAGVTTAAKVLRRSGAPAALEEFARV